MEEKPDDYEVGEVLEPIEQHTLDFYGKPLRVVRLPNGEPGVVLNELCENMGLERRAQLRRIHRTKAIETGFASARIDTPGGPQVVSVLTLKVTPAWLFGIDADRARPEVRPEIERYQAECVDVLYRYFANKTPPILPDPQSAGMQPLAPPDPEAGHEEQATYHETMSLWHRWQADRHMQAWRKEMQLQQGTVVEEGKTMGNLLSTIQERLGPPRITIGHQGLVRFYVAKLSEALHKPHGTIFGMLHTDFRVPRYQELSESDWYRIEQWFRIQFPGQKLPEAPAQSELF